MKSIIIQLIVLGVIAWLVSIAPFIEARFKSFITWVLIALAVVILIAAFTGNTLLPY